MNMRLSVLGINFRVAPLEVREQASFTSADVPEAIRQLCGQFPGVETVLLSTCNRTELYTAGIDVDAAREALIRLMLRGNVPAGLDAEKHFYAKKDLAVAEHLLAVAAGLDSMVVGETEILGQVKQAYSLAEQARTSGKALAPLFQNAFRIAKRVHTETDLCRGRVSVASIAVEFAEKVFEVLGNKTVMIVGAGETAELALKSMIERGAKDVLVLNRSLDRAEALAGRCGGRAIQYDLLGDYLPRADIVISSTSAPHCVIHEASVRKAMTVRRGLPLLLIDIAVPRDIEPAVGDLENVYLYDIDDLQRIAAGNLARRQGAVDEAWRIVREGAAELSSVFEGADLREIMRQLDEFGREASETVVQRIMAKEKMAALPEETREEVRALAQKVVAKLLAAPRDNLKRAARNGRWNEYASVVSDLFGFHAPHGSPRDEGTKENENP